MKPLILNFFRHSLFWQLIRFSITGSLSTATHFCTVISLVELWHWHPLNANAMGFTNGFFISFFGHRFWTFNSNREIRTALPAFFVTAVSVFFLNQSLFYLFLSKIHLHYLFALSFALAITSLCNFILSRHWVFKSHAVDSSNKLPDVLEE